MRLPPKQSSGVHHADDVILALVHAGVSVKKTNDMSDLAFNLLETDDEGPLVMPFPQMVGAKLVQNLMEHFGSDENSFLPYLIRLTKLRKERQH